MVTTQAARNNVTIYLKQFDIDANKILSKDISAEGYEYLLDPTEPSRGRPVEDYVHDVRYKGVEFRKWPSPTVYANVVRLLAGEALEPDVIEPENADAQREQRGPDAAVSGVTIIPNGNHPGPRGKEKATPKEGS